MLDRILLQVTRAALLVAGLAILAMTLLGGLDILSTLLLGRPVHAVYEATQTLLVIAVFLGLGMVHFQRAHIGVDIGYDLMPPAGKRASEAATLVLILTFFSALAWRGWQNAMRSWQVSEYSSGIVPFPVYPAKFALAIGCTLVVVLCLVDIARGARFRRPSFPVDE